MFMEMTLGESNLLEGSNEDVGLLPVSIKQTHWKNRKINNNTSVNSWYYRACVVVSPELSSGRDLVIQISVRRLPSTVRDFLSRAFLRNRMTYHDDIWYVGGARA